MKYLSFIAVLLCSVSCERNLYNQYVSLQTWHKDKPVIFRYEVTDTLSGHNIYVMLRNTQEYPFSNIFLINTISTPEGNTIVDTLEYEMATPEGKWLGKGFSVKESKLWYKENMVFARKGTYLFSISQADRRIGENHGVEELEGISQVGLQIEKAK